MSDTEIEFKFGIPRGRLAAVDNEVQAGDSEQIELHAQYFDTASQTLAAADVTLRLRREGKRWFQTAKAKGLGPLDRMEHNADLGELTDEPLPDIGRHAGSPVGKLLRKLLGKDATSLQATFSSDITRTRRLVTYRGTTAEVALDVGSIVATQQNGNTTRGSQIRELELELVDGNLGDLAVIAKRWQKRHQLFLSTVTKATRGQRLLDAERPVAATKASAVRYAKGHPSDGSEIQRAVVAACLSHLLPNASEVAAGNADHEIVHQLRVAIRRLRTALRELDELHPGNFDPRWEKPLKSAFDALGKRRDRELLESKLQPSLELKGAPKIQFGRVAADVQLDQAVRSTSFQAVLIELIALRSSAVHHGHATSSARTGAAHAVDRKKASKSLRRNLGSLHRKVVKGGWQFEQLSEDQQHRVRKQLKRLRYLSEFVGPIFDEKAAQAYCASLTPAQDALGDFNDKHVAVASYRMHTLHDPKAWFAVGWLSATDELDAKACSKSIRTIKGAKQFWKT